jgi:hypothetical protein
MSLTGKLGSTTYPNLLHMGFDGIGITGTLRNVYDGAGNTCPLQVSLTQVAIGSTVFNSNGTYPLTQLSSVPATPASGTTLLYSRTDNNIHYQNNTGGEKVLIVGGNSENGTAAVFDSASSTGSVLQFNGVSTGSSKISVTGGGANTAITIDAVPANFSLPSLGGILPLSMGGTGADISTPTANSLYGYNLSGATSQSYKINNGLSISGSNLNWTSYNSEYVIFGATDTSLPNNRVLTAGTNININDGGALGNLTLSVTGLTIGTNTEAWSATLDSLAANSTVGVLCYTAANTIASRTLTAGTNISITNPTGAAGNPTIGITGTVGIANGGTAVNTWGSNNNNVLVSGATATGAVQTVAIGSLNQVLLNSGSGSIPQWGYDTYSTYVNAIQTNSYYMGGNFSQLNILTAANSVATGTIYYLPFLVVQTHTYQKLGVYVSTPTSGNVNIGLYQSTSSSPTGLPTGTPLVNSGSLSTNSSNIVTFTISSGINLTPGIYWLCATTSASVPLACTQASSPLTVLYPQTNPNLGNSGFVGCTSVFSYNAVLPSSPSATPAAGNTLFPMVWIQA